jgi:hypothetical protein
VNAARIVLLVFGILFVLAAFGLIVGGGVVLAVDSSLKDEQGYFMTGFKPVQVDSSMVVTQPADIDMNTGWDRWNRSRVTLKVEAYNDDRTKPVFIGIARASDLNPYLRDSAYDEITGFDFPNDRIEFRPHAGKAGSIPPTSSSFWVASANGAGTQTLLWDISGGDYSLVVMNSDGTYPLETHVAIGAKLPGIVNGVGWGLLISGIVVLIIGGVMIFFAARGW